MINASRRIHAARCNVADSKRAAFREPRALSRKSAINVRQSRYDYQVAVCRQSIAIFSRSFSFSPTVTSDKCRDALIAALIFIEQSRRRDRAERNYRRRPEWISRRAKRWRIPIHSSPDSYFLVVERLPVDLEPFRGHRREHCDQVDPIRGRCSTGRNIRSARRN